MTTEKIPYKDMVAGCAGVLLMLLSFVAGHTYTRVDALSVTSGQHEVLIKALGDNAHKMESKLDTTNSALNRIAISLERIRALSDAK